MEDNKRTVYIAGKITGDPDYRGKFAAARKELEAGGFIVLDPTILPEAGFDYEAYMRMTGAMLAECTAVCFLPCWRHSNGAWREKMQAIEEEKEIMYYEKWRGENGRIRETATGEQDAAAD